MKRRSNSTKKVVRRAKKMTIFYRNFMVNSPNLLLLQMAITLSGSRIM